MSQKHLNVFQFTKTTIQANFFEIRESDYAVRDQQIKELFILGEIRRTIDCLENRSLRPVSKFRNEILHQDFKNLRNFNMSSTPKQKKAIQQSNKVISAPERSLCSPTSPSPFPLPRPTELWKQQPSQSFSLFDDFTFSLPPSATHGNQRWTASFEQFRMGSFNQNSYVRDDLVDDFTPRFSNLSLQPEEARSLFADPTKMDVPRDCGIFSTLVQDKGYSGPRGKIIGSINPSNPEFQPAIFPEKGFLFLQPGPSNVVPNGIPCVYAPIPGIGAGICVIPQQMPYTEPWPQNLVDNRAYYGCSQHLCMPPSCAGYVEDSTPSNVHRIPESYTLTSCNQHVRFDEVQIQECVESQEDVEYQQQSEAAFQPQTTFKGRRQKSRTAFEKPKSARKIQTVLNPCRRNQSVNQEIFEQQDFVSKQAEPIPKGARPILSARK